MASTGAGAGGAGKQQHFDAQLKVLLLGDSGAGKTSLLLRWTDDKFSPSFVSTIGIDMKPKVLTIDGSLVRMQVWDTAGQERFRAVTRSYLRGAHAVLLAFDSTSKHSFDHVTTWVQQVAEHGDEGVAKVLVSTKCDLADKQAVTEAEARALAAQYGMRYFATSAKLNSGVDEAFDSLAREALKRAEATGAVKKAAPAATIKPAANDATSKSGCAC
jgi:Ras-related protein Rab-8A